MTSGIVEIAEPGRYLHQSRGFLQVEREGEETAAVPLDEVGILLVDGQGCGLSSRLLSVLAGRGAVTVLCDSHYLPEAIVLPCVGNQELLARSLAQIDASLPLKKRLWQRIVMAKIERQARVLELCGQQERASELSALAKRVGSGDPDNKEAQAARKYWQTLFGEGFRRSDEEQPLNAFLNYGYAVIRAACARAVVCAGLLPQFGLYHHSGRDPFALADDLMEPYRPVVDCLVRQLADREDRSLDPTAKRQLAAVLHLDTEMEKGTSTLTEAIHQTALSLVRSFVEKKDCLCLPDPLESGMPRLLDT